MKKYDYSLKKYDYSFMRSRFSLLDLTIHPARRRIKELEAAGDTSSETYKKLKATDAELGPERDALYKVLFKQPWDRPGYISPFAVVTERKDH